ncbi:unnamed protein product [Closterium sp. NIES-54]
MAGPEERVSRVAGGSGEAQAQGQPRDSAMAPMQPSLGPPRDEPRVFGLDKFNGDNFAEWSFKMENIFDHYDLLEVMEGMEKRPENDPEKSPTTLTPLPAPVPVKLADPSEGPVVARSSTVLPCLAPSQVAASAQVSASGQVAASCSCRLLSHQTLLWHHRLGYPSLPRLRGMHSRLLVSGLPRSLPPLPPSPAPPCLPCVEGQQRAAPHSSSFPSTTAPLQTLHMDVWGPARVTGQGRERYFPRAHVRLQLRERFQQDLLVLRLQSHRGGEFSSDLLRDFCRGEGILQSFTLPDSPQQNGIAERGIGLVMEVARTSMIHAAVPHFLWPFAVQYAADQLKLWPRVSLLETSPTLRWTGEIGDAFVFWVWGSRAFVRDTSADKLSPCAIPCVAVGSDAARGAASGDVASRGAEPGGVGSEGAETGGAEPGGVWTGGAEPGGAEPEGVEPGGAASEGADSGGAEPQGAASSRANGAGGAGGAGAGGAGVAGAGGDGVAAGASGAGGAAATGRGGARTRGTGAAGTGGVEGAGAGGAGAAGAVVGGIGAGGTGAVDPCAGGAGGTMRPRPYFVPLLQQVLVAAAVQPASPLLAPSPYTELSGGLTERREPTSRLVSPYRTARRAPRLRPPLVPGTHAMALRPSSIPLRVPLPPPPKSSLPEVPDPESDRARAVSLDVSHLLHSVVIDPSFESAVASALVAELLDFASASPPSVGGECALGTDVLEDRQEDFECLAAAVPRFASMLLALEGVPDAPDIPTPRSYAEAITVDGMWIFRVKRPPGSPPAFKARYVARGFSQRQGVDYFHTFSPTPKMTTLRVLLHVAAQRDYELHSLEFSTAFLQGSLHEEIWLRRPPGFTGKFPADASWVDDLAEQRSSQGYTFNLGAMLADLLAERLGRVASFASSSQRGQLRLEYVAIRANTADVFTKALPSGDHQHFATLLGLVPTLPHLLTA